MGSRWCGFLPQNDIIKLQWAVLEGCQTDVAAKALSALLGKAAEGAAPPNADESEESSWSSEDFGMQDTKAK